MKKIRVTIWNEFVHEKTDDLPKSLYPQGIHQFIADFLGPNKDFKVTAVSLDMPDQGLPNKLLNKTDVLIWWGHCEHWKVDDELVERIRMRVLKDGMGLICLHSAHHSKIFRALLGCTGDLNWGDNMPSVVWNLLPTHPIAQGIPACFELEGEELYSEPFFIPVPDELVFTSWYPNGNIFRSGACYYKGCGKVFYFQPGHEECNSYYNPYVQRVISNAIYWCAPGEKTVEDATPYIGPGYFKVAEPRYK